MTYAYQKITTALHLGDKYACLRISCACYIVRDSVSERLGHILGNYKYGRSTVKLVVYGRFTEFRA